jgi:O-antigen ligase
MDKAFEGESLSLKPPAREAGARMIGAILFYSLLAVIALAAIPYGAVEPWWRALFQCLVFSLAGLCVIERLLSREANWRDYHLFLPVLALIVFAFLQTVSWSHPSTAGIVNVTRTLSADAFQTRLFAIHLCSLVVIGWLLVLHTTTQRRLRHLVELVILTGFISASFGLLRQASQRSAGFFLPYLRPGFGYGQFVNSNHFAFLMEMTLGLALGIAVCRGVTGRRLAMYVMAAVPMWVALVLANSRGGILSILCQVLFLGILFLGGRSPGTTGRTGDPQGWFARTSRLIAVRGILIVALLTVAIVTVIFVGGEPLVGKLETVSVEFSRETADTYTLRQNIWRTTWELIKDHPVAGVGFGGYWIAITKYHRASGETTPQEAHNDYLELLASGGLIGLSIAVWFIVMFVRAARRKMRGAHRYSRAVTLGALAGILAVAVHSLVDFGLHITINALVFTALLSMVTIDIGEERCQIDSLPTQRN